MDRVIVRELRMERGHQYRALTGHDAFPLMLHQRRDRGSHAADARSPDEDELERRRARAEISGHLGLEGLLLPPIGIALGGDVDEAERALRGALDVAGQEDEPRAGAEDRLARRVELLERGEEVPGVHELEQGRALAAGHDEAGEPVQLRRLADLPPRYADPLQRPRVQPEIPLQREHADRHARRSRSHASTVSAFRSGGNTGYQTFTIWPPSTCQAMRLMRVERPPPGAANSNVGSASARVSPRAASLRISKGM